MSSDGPLWPLPPASGEAVKNGNGNGNGKFQRLAGFAGLYEFALDPFQLEACRALESGRGVLVAAPTGAGKTVVGEFAIHLALTSGTRAFYTTPIKALSNQKYAELQRRYGPQNVGLLTGDNAINGNAAVVVMTTEVLRNMIYANSAALDQLSHVVMDEVHYLADKSRGAVWEEVLINLPQRVTITALSATVSNAEEFGRWLGTVRGGTDVIVEEHRPVPLWQHVLVGSHLYDLFVGDVLTDKAADPDPGPASARQQVNPELLQRAREEQRRGTPGRSGSGRGRSRGRGGAGRGGHRSRRQPVSRSAVVRRLAKADLLPAICFIFSRAGCEAAVDQCLAGGIRLTNQHEQQQIRDFAERACAAIDEPDLAAVGYHDWLQALEHGLAAHHAGMVPVFKEVVEQLFQRGLVRCVFATETLALGINMPARSVVLERLVKWNGESHVQLTPGEYTQLTGRAGRRGIDIEGHAVVVWDRQLDPGKLAGLASTRTYPLRSSFSPSYNMAVNLVATIGRDRAAAVLDSSFAQFQADESVVEWAAELERNQTSQDGFRDAMACHLGDFTEYAEIRERLRSLERAGSQQRRREQREGRQQLLSQAQPGDVVRIGKGRRALAAVVVRAAFTDDPEPKPLVLDTTGRTRRLVAADLSGAGAALGQMPVPGDFRPRSEQDRRRLAEQLAEFSAGLPDAGQLSDGDSASSVEVRELRHQLRQHPCHSCDEREDHARWAARYHRLERQSRKLRRRIETRVGSIRDKFNRICDLLLELGYLETVAGRTEVTPAGRMLARIYGEADLLTAESVRRGSLQGLGPAELASVVAAAVYESRGRDDSLRPRLPRGAAGEAIRRFGQDWERLRELEARHGLSTIRDLDLGLCWPIYRWANGTGLDQVLWESELTAGDFVRWSKQVIDLLGQMGQADPGGDLARTARRAAAMLDRGVVTYAGVHEDAGL